MRNNKFLFVFLIFILSGFSYAGLNFVLLGKIQLCIWRALTGFPCPGCGLTHAASCLCQGKISESLFWHPLLLLLVPTILFSCFPAGMWKTADMIKRQYWWYYLLNGLFLALYVIRLIVCYPQQNGPMFYDKANYIALLLSFF